MVKPFIKGLERLIHLNKDAILIANLAGIVILAGGASRRMGTPKAELILPSGERLLDYHVRQALKLLTANTSLADKSIPIMIADNGRGFLVDKTQLAEAKTPICHITDYNSPSVVAKSETQGPLVAIESALQELAKLKKADKVERAEASWLMVISCDSLISAYDLWKMLGSYTVSIAHDQSVICLTDTAHLYPLLGLYHLTVEPELQAYIDSGERQVMRFIRAITKAVPVAAKWQSLTNFNTPDDFKRACTALM